MVLSSNYRREKEAVFQGGGQKHPLHPHYSGRWLTFLVAAFLCTAWGGVGRGL